ncbi:mucin-7-like isoform X2 [Acropora muricata]|uniref:mucin-7-like isoform X2 n=1 Tax=Acropora muricata TaxID=159855 RepID=UPI0034E53429
MEKISVFLLLLGVLQFLSKNPSFGIEINNKCSTLFHKVKGKALSGHVISVHQASSEIACTHKCLSNPKCASFNFELQQSRSLSTCELNAVSRTSPYNELKSRHGFAYYEPLTPREMPKQEITGFSPTTSNLIMARTTTQGAQEVSPTQDQATTPASRVPSTQPATTAAQEVSPATTQGAQEVSPTQDQATTPASRVPSTQPTTTAAQEVSPTTTRGAQEVSPTQDQATTPTSRVPSTQPATTAAQEVSPTTAQGAQEVSPTQDQATTPTSRVPSTQPATTAAQDSPTTAQGAHEVSPTQDQATTSASRVPSTQPATTAAPVSNCGQYWYTYKSGCLRLFEDGKTWVDANQHCATFNTRGKGNGRLISIFSKDDNNQIVKHLSKGEYYIGLNDLNKTGTYRWVDGTTASFTDWKNGFPKANDRKDGVVIKKNGNDGKWQMKDSDIGMPFICECPDGPCA